VPDTAGQAAGHAHNADDAVDRHIAYLVARGFLFTVRDPMTDELTYGATPKGQRWLAEHDGWPEPLPATPPQKTRPAPSPAHAAPRRRLVRRTLLAGVTAAISVPSIAIAGRVIAPQNVDDTPNIVEPDVDSTLDVPGTERATSPMEEAREPRPAAPARPAARARHSLTPEVSPTPTESARKQDSRAHGEYIGRHRGRPADERLEDVVTDAVAALIKDQHLTVHFTLPPVGSQGEVTVHTHARDDDEGCDRSERQRGTGHP
jgi:hypothetical protein